MIEHSQRLEESIQARDEFLSIASHELKTPITSLKLQFQMAAKLAAANNPEVYSKERVERRIAIANRQLERMAKLIEDMLDVSRITTGKLAMNVEKVDLPLLVEEVLDRFSEQLRSAGIEVKREIPKSPVVIEADRYRLEQLLDNLLTNAIKYGEGKPIGVKVQAFADRVEINIRDHGMGIAKENLERIFQRFERVASPTNIAGLGIGLYVSKKIVEAQGGSIAVDSQLGQGSTFLIRLPYRQTRRSNAA
jgi:signal transduction histidine kinase